MPRDFGYWMTTSRAQATETPIVTPVVAQNLMKPVAELEDDLSRVMRNLYPIDIPRGHAHDAEVMKILERITLPIEYANSPVWQHAHQLYAQIQAMKGNSNFLMYHPV